jgi:hypothetical protein
MESIRGTVIEIKGIFIKAKEGVLVAWEKGKGKERDRVSFDWYLQGG